MGRYDEVFQQKDEERKKIQNDEERQRQEQKTFSDQYVSWRNGLKQKIAKRAVQLETEHPALGQLFVEDVQDQLRIRKSNPPPWQCLRHVRQAWEND